jgi:hypothetical protein
MKYDIRVASARGVELIHYSPVSAQLQQTSAIAPLLDPT